MPATEDPPAEAIQDDTIQDLPQNQDRNSAEIASQLQEFFKKQDTFNQKPEEQVKQALTEATANAPKSKLLPKELTVTQAFKTLLFRFII